uniref:putative LAGLIDADG homing endonuclease n=1 Tax=Coelastrella saipanensis TaxID=152631 RepID=UPI0010C24865|nr:putative LAGLIDADG homing endonuclease [Coelastrella saipanensis]YP_009629513.1 putative LAGLIDADG homing endonuclease [Coelastrella saipanensis]AVV61586.1 putative LAGLIDADG homing endonuclease [Coelastrella saipanensis]AVV61623.1 putative LAGLIDADG homing endonuclease [Coelastrella saipanensis]
MNLLLKPGEKLPQTLLDLLKEANESRRKKKNNFSEYKKKIQEIFKCKDYVPLTESQKYYLGGFLEGEGSLIVGAKKSKNSRFGAYLDPAFNVTQHVNGVKHLFECLCFFGTGRIRHKSSSNATLVFEIDTRQSLQQKLVPFYREYVVPSSCQANRARFEKFCYLLDAFDQEKHLDFQSFVYELGPIWDEMRMQKGQSNETFKSLEDFQQYCTECYREKQKTS